MFLHNLVSEYTNFKFVTGTTISLLKFPIVNPEPWKLTARVNRLKEQSTKEVMQKQMKKHEEEDNKEKKGFRLKGKSKSLPVHDHILCVLF